MLNKNFRSTGKTAVFIDGAYMHMATQSLGFTLDYRKLTSFLVGRTTLLRSYYYMVSSPDEEYNVLKPLIDWLSYNNYQVITKPCRDYPEANGQRRNKPSMAVDMAVDILEIQYHVDQVVIAAGNTDLRRVVESVQRQGTIVTLLATLKAKGLCCVSDDLRRQADHFLDLADIQTEIERQMERPTQIREMSGAA